MGDTVSLSISNMAGKQKSTKAAAKQPSREEMHSVVADMLKEVDFNTVSTKYNQSIIASCQC